MVRHLREYCLGSSLTNSLKSNKKITTTIIIFITVEKYLDNRKLIVTTYLNPFGAKQIFAPPPPSKKKKKKIMVTVRSEDIIHIEIWANVGI